EISMTLRKNALHCALARPFAEPAATHETFCGNIDVEGVAGTRVEEALNTTRHMRYGVIGAQKSNGSKPRDACHPDKSHAGHEEQRAPHQRYQHRLAEVGLRDQQRDYYQQQHE